MMASPASACLDEARRAENMFGIPPLILQAIIVQESGGNPLALNIDGESVYPKTVEEANAIVREREAQAGNIDIGCGQISMRYHGTFFEIRPEIAFDSWVNVVYASKVLLENYRRLGTWTDAVAHYHSGNPQRQEAYVCRIMAAMRGLAAGGDRPVKADCRP